MRLSVEWREGWGNSPDFVIEGEKELLPVMKDSEFEFHDGLWIHIAENGFVKYFAHPGHGNQGGYGGAAFTFLYNGRPKTLYGPWSSRAGCVNQRGFDVVDVILRTPDGIFHTAVTLDLLLQLACEQDGPDAEFVIIKDISGEPVYYPSIMPDQLMKPSGMIVDRGHKYECIWEPGNA